MRRVFVLIVALAVLGVSAGLASAAPAPKVDVCHFDADTGLYHKINISENAFQKHIDHGDSSPGDPYPGAMSIVGDTTTNTPWGSVHLVFGVFDGAVFDADCQRTASLTGSLTWDRSGTYANYWQGSAVYANFAAGVFTVRVNAGGTPSAINNCDIQFTVTDGGADVGTWRVSALFNSPGEYCSIKSQTQGPWTINSGQITFSP